MKILIIGTGVIGSIYGWALSKKNEVVHYVREKKISELDQKLRIVDMLDERLPEGKQHTKDKYRYKCTSDFSYDYDLIIVPTTYDSAIDILKTINAQKSNAKIFIMALNWSGTDEIDNIVSKENYVLGYAGAGGTIKKENDHEVLWADIGADFMLGQVYPEQEKVFNMVKEIFTSCGITPNVPKNIIHSLWMHNIGSAALGAALSTYDNMDKLLNDKELVEVSFRAMSEEYKIAEKRGVDLSLYPEVEMYKMPFDVLYPMFINNFKTNPAMQRYTAHAEKAVGEMVNNFVQIYKTGKEMNIDMPCTEKLYSLVGKISD